MVHGLQGLFLSRIHVVQNAYILVAKAHVRLRQICSDTALKEWEMQNRKSILLQHCWTHQEIEKDLKRPKQAFVNEM